MVFMPPIFFMNLNEHHTETVNMPKLKLIYLKMSYISTLILTTNALACIITATFTSMNMLSFSFIPFTFFIYWIMLKFTYARKEKYVKREYTTSVKTRYHRDMNWLIIAGFITSIFALLVLYLTG